MHECPKEVTSLIQPTFFVCYKAVGWNSLDRKTVKWLKWLKLSVVSIVYTEGEKNNSVKFKGSTDFGIRTDTHTHTQWTKVVE